VLLISRLDELIGLSDTHQGASARPARRHLRPASVTPEVLGYAMTGAGAREPA
jgi:hypothetical protein